MTTLHDAESRRAVRKRLASELAKFSPVVIAGIGYYIFVLINGKGLPCIFNVMTGLLCPACGVSRMIVSLSKLDLLAAFHYNMALFVTLPLLAAIFIRYEARYIKTGEQKLGKTEQKLLIWEIVVLVLFGMARNLI